MDLVRKVPVPEEVFPVLVSCKSDLNDLFIRRFRCTAEVTGPRIAPASAPGKVYEKHVPPGVLISVWKDDLTRQDTDVVVNAANEKLDHCGGLALALVEAGGQQIVQDSVDWISSNGELGVADIAVTRAGNLPSKYIVHVVGPRWSPGASEKCAAQLQEAIKNVLDYVIGKSHLRSVAIPAVSSGIFGFPLDHCANIIVSTIVTFCHGAGKGHLKEIRLVNHDDKTVQAMRAACERILGSNEMTSGAASTSYSAKAKGGHQEASSETFLSIDGLNLHLRTGKIEDEKTEVIVNSIPAKLDLTCGAISAAIYQKAGNRLQKEVWEKSLYSSSKMIPTRGYNLPCRHVYHVILCTGREAERTLREVTRECLTMAHRYGAPSISFPALGTGNIGLPKQMTADIMVQEVLEFARGNKCKMDVYLIIHPQDRETLQVFQAKLKASGIRKEQNIEGSASRTGLAPSAGEMCVNIAGGCSEDVAEAGVWLWGLLSSPGPFLIHNNLLLLFGSKEFGALASAADCAHVEEELSGPGATLRIGGPLPDRVRAVVQAERLLLEVQQDLAEALEEELLEVSVIWIYETQSESHRYPVGAARELERAHATQTNVTLRGTPWHMVDMKNLTAKDGHRTFTIRRICLGGSLPSTWTFEESWTREVDPRSRDFEDRRKEFQQAGLTLLKNPGTVRGSTLRSSCRTSCSASMWRRSRGACMCCRRR
ncbi:protein mono-ADP-ribosyltransferase PARP9 isoform X2 [Engystomops pustulosus]|uniref:protein mono-ADP-ribosyltransferase PARP9 isoform X2 n=1 Tax=Engystomops pustulosus TaxID=76066 RepID=UPI003AFA15C8